METKPDQTHDLHVLIAGAGSAGLLVAQVLKRLNIACTVFEQDASPYERPRDWNFGIYWAQSRLDECLSEDMRARVVDVQTDPSHRPSEDTVMPIYNGQTGEHMKDLPAPFSIRLHRRRWLEMLSDGVNIKFGKRLKSVTTEADIVTITFEDGTQAKGNLLIGAEGAHSPTREYLLGIQEAALLPSPVVASVSICKVSREAAQKLRALHSRYVITFHPKGIFTFMSKEWLWMMMQTWRSDADTGLIGRGKEPLKLEKWHEMGRDFGPPFKEIFETIEPSSTIWHNRLGYWPTKPWDSKGLVTLIGDAAHPMTFHRGQGLNYAITDTAELLQQLNGMTEHSGAELAAAVKRYEADLFPRGREGVIASNENTNAVHDWETMMESSLFKEGLQRAESSQTT
ncbi:hypothetical protein OIDMADRAFT_169581 [Oidiodendron maius Zn]|uniref:FAD-binding domain-containing protein n=1 Tax=Oidiodendron maius (strain Zn) TaxID=913774 RepID=A0A0C3D4D5_OIDMZ|nr:hypothetical protein OIDMADRAFT_169581 [Oidiodendron maius Zn]